MAAASYRGVEAMLSRHPDVTGDESATALAQRITGRHGSGRNAIAAALQGLAADVRMRPSLASAVSTASEPAVLGDLADKYHAALRRAGSMSVFGGRTWDEEPDQAWQTFRAFVERPANVRLAESARRAARAEVEQQLHEDRGWRATRILNGQLTDVRRAFIRREADDAAELLRRREQTKASVLMLGGMTRRIDRELASRLIARGELQEPSDIDFVTEAESASLLRGDGPSFATIATRRRRLATATLDGPLPLRFTGDPPPVRMPSTGTLYRGWGASAGKYEGVARVVESPSDARLCRGDVLVARNTDASWAPLFLIAGAMVVEEGGPLSHAAIVARELGVPAVLNVPGLVDRLRREAGEFTLTVDGSTGEVAIHRERPHPAAGVVPSPQPARTRNDAMARLNVFVTGLVGASALFSMAAALTQSLGSVPGRERVRRRAAAVAEMTATAVLEGFERTADSAVGLRSRGWYAAAAGGLMFAAVALFTRSTETYLHSGDATGAAVVAWAVTLSSATVLAVGGVVASQAALHWPRVPLVMRRFAPDRATWWTRARAAMHPASAGLLAVSTAVVLTLAVLVTVRFPPLYDLDEWTYEQLGWRSGADRWTPDQLNVIGRPVFSIALAIVMAMLALRCRLLAVSLPTAIVGAGLTVFALTWLTNRERPSLGGHAGEHNSFPGGHSAQLTLLFGLVPLVAYAVSRRSWVRTTARVASTAILAVLLADTWRTGGHWPSDHLAGVLIGLAAVVVVHARVAARTLHEGCRGCAFMATEGER
jgi:phosphohistidine swiveling domain-containing protein